MVFARYNREKNAPEGAFFVLQLNRYIFPNLRL